MDIDIDIRVKPMCGLTRAFGRSAPCHAPKDPRLEPSRRMNMATISFF